jgi:lysophospholipase L1-like esterase
MGKSRKPVVIVAALALVAAGGGAAYGVRKNIMEQQACSTVKAQVAETGLVRTVSDGGRKVSVLGDSYSIGAGLSNRADAGPTLVGKAEKWSVSVAGVGGTGFVNEGPCGGQSFGQRLDNALASNPETLIIAGGVNDSDADPAKVEQSAAAVLTLTKSVPKVVVIGPANAPAKKNLPAIDKALAEAAATNGREYISALPWDLEYQPDNLHPTKVGQAAYAANVAAAL